MVYSEDSLQFLSVTDWLSAGLEHGDARRHALPVPGVRQQRPRYVQQPRAHVHPPGLDSARPGAQVDWIIENHFEILQGWPDWIFNNFIEITL